MAWVQERLGLHQVVFKIYKALIPREAVGLLKIAASRGKITRPPTGTGHEKLNFAAGRPALEAVFQVCLGRREIVAVESLPGQPPVVGSTKLGIENEEAKATE
jgi:hypothetical protein